MTNPAALRFSRIQQSRVHNETRRFLDNPFALKLDKKLAYYVECFGRKFIFATNRQFTRGVLWKNVLLKQGILGPILTYSPETNTYSTSRVMVSRPISGKKIAIEMLNLQGKSLYAGIGNVSGSGIDFVVKSEPGEARVRSVVHGRIGPSAIVFKKASASRPRRRLATPARSHRPQLKNSPS